MKSNNTDFTIQLNYLYSQKFVFEDRADPNDGDYDDVTWEDVGMFMHHATFCTFGDGAFSEVDYEYNLQNGNY